LKPQKRIIRINKQSRNHFCRYSGGWAGVMWSRSGIVFVVLVACVCVGRAQSVNDSQVLMSGSRFLLPVGLGTCSYQDPVSKLYYDLSGLSGSDIPGTDPSFTYQLNVCGVSQETTCNQKGGSVCQYQQNPTTFYHLCAKWDQPQWQLIDPDPQKGIQITITGGDGGCGSPYPNRQVILQVSCNAQSPMKPSTVVVNSVVGICSYTIPLSSPAGCPSSTPPPEGGGGKGLSGGWIFIIILLVAFFLYLVAGWIYKRHKGASGVVDACPNVEFWRDLPSLVKEGCLFTWSKMRGQSYESYQTLK